MIEIILVLAFPLVLSATCRSPVMSSMRWPLRYWFLPACVIALACLAGLGYWWRFGSAYQPPARSFDGKSVDLRETVIVPTLDTPIPNGKSAIWCASFQLAWNQLKTDVAKGPVLVKNAEVVAERLNRAEQSADDLAAGMYYAAAGLDEEGIQEKIRADMKQKFPGIPLPVMQRGGATAFGYLRAEVKYTHPYLMNPNAFMFTDSRKSGTAVSSFGIPPSSSFAPEKLSQQIQVLYAASDRIGQVTEFAVDLCKDSRPNQVVLACFERGETLAGAWAELQRRISANEVSSFSSLDRLLVPTMHWRIEHHFTELEGPDKILLNPALARVYLDTAVQSIEFRLDPEGAFVASSAMLHVKSAPPRNYQFNRPFLIYLKKRDAPHPFFVMWVDNAELLVR